MDTDTKIHRLWELVNRTEAELAAAKAELEGFRKALMEEVDARVDAQFAAIDARNKALDEAAEYCRTHGMATPYRNTKPTHDRYVEDIFDTVDGMSHQGMGYAVAIEALKEQPQ